MRCQNATATDARKKTTVRENCRRLLRVSACYVPLSIATSNSALDGNASRLRRHVAVPDGIICGLVHLREVGEEFGKAKIYQLGIQNAKERAQFKFCGSIDQNTVLHGQEQLFNR